MSLAADSRPETARAPALARVSALVAALDAAGVSFCHWKSNDQLARSWSGENDLDLLVERRHADRLLAVAAALGFKRMESRLDRRFPGLEDYYGLDPASGRFVHLHVHYALVLGEALLKNHRLPIEREMLATARRDGGMPVADPAVELAVLVVRALLKKRALQLLRPGSSRRLSASTRAELGFLLSRTSPADARAFVAAHLRALPPELFDEGLEALRSDVPLWRLLALRRRWLVALAPYRRQGRLGAAALFVARRLFLFFTLRLSGHPPRKRPATGGLAIALLGSDGSGKSTAVEDLSTWLGHVCDVRRAHLGKPPRSAPARLLDRAIGALRRLAGPRAGTAWSLPGDAREAPAWLQWLNGLQLLLLARARFREYRRVRRLVGQGAVVLCDRFPRRELALMESPGAQALPLASHWSLRGLVAAEQRLYARIDPPEVTLVLRVTPEVAAGRTGDAADFVLRRAREVRAFADAGHPGVLVVDADQSLERVREALREAVWSVL